MAQLRKLFAGNLKIKSVNKSAISRDMKLVVIVIVKIYTRNSIDPTIYLNPP